MKKIKYVLIPIIQNELLHHVSKQNLNFYVLNSLIFVVIPPVYVPVSDRAVFDSTTSERMQIQPDSTVPMDCK
jgi:hypothetical protein